MITAEISGSVNDQAASSIVSISVPKDYMEEKFTEYWEQVKDLVDPSVIKESQKGGYRDVSMHRVAKAAGGIAQFFKPVLSDAIQEYLNGEPRQALTIAEVDVEQRGDTYNVQALVFLEPWVTWKKDSIPGLNVTLSIKIPKQVENMLELLVNDKLQRDQDAHAILVPEADGTATADGHVIILDSESLLSGGSKWEAGTFAGNKWDVNPHTIKVPAIYTAVIGMKAGESKKVAFTLDDKFEGMAGQIINGTFKVHQVYKKDTPKLDDDLAKSCGYNDFIAYKEAITNSIKTQLETDRKQLIQANLAGVLTNPETVKVGPIPNMWVVGKANELYKTNRQMVRTEAELVARFQGATTMNGTPITDKNTILRYLGERAAQSLYHSLVVRDWGKQAEIKGDTKLDSMHLYVPVVEEALMNKVKVDEYDPQAKSSSETKTS